MANKRIEYLQKQALQRIFHETAVINRSQGNPDLLSLSQESRQYLTRPQPEWTPPPGVQRPLFEDDSR